MTLANATARAAVRIVYRRQYRAFLEATKEPRAAQTALLRRIVAANADTDFGREHPPQPATPHPYPRPWHPGLRGQGLRHHRSGGGGPDGRRYRLRLGFRAPLPEALPAGPPPLCAAGGNRRYRRLRDALSGHGRVWPRRAWRHLRGHGQSLHAGAAANAHPGTRRSALARGPRWQLARNRIVRVPDAGAQSGPGGRPHASPRRKGNPHLRRHLAEPPSGSDVDRRQLQGPPGQARGIVAAGRGGGGAGLFGQRVSGHGESGRRHEPVRTDPVRHAVRVRRA